MPVPQVVHDFADALGRSSLAIGLLVVGAGLRIGELMRPGAAASLAVFLKLDRDAGAGDRPRAAVRAWRRQSRRGRRARASVPAASNSYILAKQMGGDAPLIAQILTLQTMLAAC